MTKLLDTHAEVRPVMCRDAEDFTQKAVFRIASVLDAAIAERGAATIALAGGSTPGPVYDRLGLCLIEWSRVTATLVDERWTPEHRPDSNARLVRESLLAGPARACRFVAFRRAGPTPQAAAERLDRAFRALPRPLDLVVLGMGDDGHIASLFPHAPELVTGLDPRSAARCMAVAPGHTAPLQPRVTLTARTLLDAQRVILLIRGAAKWSALQSALTAGPFEDAPVRAVLHQSLTPLEIYWAP